MNALDLTGPQRRGTLRQAQGRLGGTLRVVVKSHRDRGHPPHLAGVDDALVTVRPVLDRVPHLKALLEADAEEDLSDLRRAETTGRPLGAPEFVSGLEKKLGRTIARRPPAANLPVTIGTS